MSVQLKWTISVSSTVYIELNCDVCFAALSAPHFSVPLYWSVRTWMNADIECQRVCVCVCTSCSDRYGRLQMLCINYQATLVIVRERVHIHCNDLQSAPYIAHKSTRAESQQQCESWSAFISCVCVCIQCSFLSRFLFAKKSNTKSKSEQNKKKNRKTKQKRRRTQKTHISSRNAGTNGSAAVTKTHLVNR